MICMMHMSEIAAAVVRPAPSPVSHLPLKLPSSVQCAASSVEGLITQPLDTFTHSKQAKMVHFRFSASGKTKLLGP